jgi:endonuclease-8
VPEGDTLRHTASRLRPPLLGARVVSLGGTHPAVRGEGRRARGSRVEEVRAVGKHLLIDFDHGWTLRTHLGMNGRWDVYPAGGRWRASPGKARVVLDVAAAVAVCFAAPTVQFAPRALAAAALDHLGPDLAAADVDLAAVVPRARTSAAATAADLLLDQRVMAGVGNVIKNETLFLERVDPHTPAAALGDDVIAALARRAHVLLVGNSGRRARSTTGQHGKGRRTWVYRRAGLPCRRCETPVAHSRHGDLDRSTYWCPRCQAPTMTP